MKRIDFDNGKITTNIFQAAIPMLIAQILSLLYNIVDRIYIARIPDIGTTALGAVGLCFPIIVIITAFSNLFGSGGAPIFSIERGRNDTKRAGMIMNTSFFMLTICSVLLMCIGFLFAKPILTIFGASDAYLLDLYSIFFQKKQNTKFDYYIKKKLRIVGKMQKISSVLEQQDLLCSLQTAL